MDTMKIAFFDTKSYDKEYFLQAAKDKTVSNIDFSFSFFDVKLNANTAVLAKEHDAVCVFVNDTVDAATIDMLVEQGIKYVALRCAGYNNVDLRAIWKKLHVCRVPAYSPHAVAEHALALLQTLNRRIHTAYNRIRDGNFSLAGLVGRDLYGQTAGIIGTGKIGKAFASIMAGFGMKILLNDLYPDTDFAQKIDASYVSMEEIFKLSDVISLHCPLTPENYHVINAKSLDMMKKNAIIINTGRGALIDSKALIEALKTGSIRGAGLDVYEEEETYFFEDWSLSPIQDDVLARLIQFPNVLLTSHQAFLTEEALSEIAKTTLENLSQFAEKQTCENEICYCCTETGLEPECIRDKTGWCWKNNSA